MPVLSPAPTINGPGNIPPARTGFGGGGSGDGDGEGRWRWFPTELSQLGIALGLASVTTFFGALVIAYGVILSRTAGGTRIHVPLTLGISTALILLSSFSLERVRYALRRGLVARSMRRLNGTVLLGAAFLSSQLLAWADLARQGVYLEANPHGSVFYVFTGVHGLHVLGGILWLLYLWRKAAACGIAEKDLREMRQAVSAATAYWHFMGALWICLFLILLAWTS
jgi:cytochrome c oxidase subunit III